MAVLAIRHIPGQVFICAVEDWLQNAEEKDVWQHFVTLIVRYAYECRGASFITLAPARWSIGNSLPNARKLMTSRGQFLVNHIECCSSRVLSEVSVSEDFRRGLLLLSSVDPGDEAQLLSVINDLDTLSASPQVSNCEVLALLDDGRSVYWFNPIRDTRVVEHELVSFVRHAGWRVVIS